MKYPTSYHLACKHLVASGAHSGNTKSGRFFVAQALRDIRKARGRKEAKFARRHMLFISGMFPIKT